MNDCSIGPKQHIDISICGVSLSKWLECLLDRIFIQFDTNMISTLCTDKIIRIQVEWTTDISVMNDIIVSKWVESLLAIGEYPYCRAYI
jgi:hypothetical protein